VAQLAALGQRLSPVRCRAGANPGRAFGAALDSGNAPSADLDQSGQEVGLGSVLDRAEMSTRSPEVEQLPSRQAPSVNDPLLIALGNVVLAAGRGPDDVDVLALWQVSPRGSPQAHG
jgi:hypothetical protein